MSVFRVWAPHAKQIEVELTGRRTSMAHENGGWWSVDLPAANAGADYGFRVDGSDLLPDPRSPWQPHGIHNPSRLVDHAAFPWTDQHWQARPLSAAVLYELHITSFTPTGTFEAAIERLDHLVDLGITHVEIMPVAQFGGRWGWGYDGVDLYAPQNSYGGPEGLKSLVNACHEKGLAVLLDVVYNHLGPAGNYLSRFGPYFTKRHTTPWGEAVNLDGPHSDEVRRFFIDNALMWLRDYHVDGLRIDAVHQLVDDSAIHLLEQMSNEVKSLEALLGKHLVLIGESDLNNPRLIWRREVGGYNLDAQWNEDFHHALHAVLTGETSGYYVDFGSVAQLAKTLEKAFAYDGCYSVYRKRVHGRSADGVAGESFIGYTQNHDQIGNRAAGERINAMITPNRVKIGAAIMLTAPFVPMLFMGQEWAASTPFLFFTDHEDPDLALSVSQGRRKEFAAFGWKPQDVPDPQDPATLERSKLNWDEIRRPAHADMLSWYKDLIRLRRSRQDLSDGAIAQVRARHDADSQWLCIERGEVTIACNLSRQQRCVPIRPNRSRNILLTSEPAVRLCSEGAQMGPDSVSIFGPGSPVRS